MIRYRTRDLSRLYVEPCACGRTLVRMERIMGRTDDMLIIRGVNVFPGQIEELILKCAGLTPHYQLELTRREQLDAMAIHVERAPGAEAEHLQRELRHSVKAYVGISVDVVIHEPGAIERSAGKAKRLVDRRPKR